VLAYLASESAGARIIEADGAPGLRTEQIVRPGPEAEFQYASRRVEYTLAVPGNPGRWLVAAFSTPGSADPDGQLARLLTELFDAIMLTFRWLPPSEQPRTRDDTAAGSLPGRAELAMTRPDDPATPPGWGRIAVHYDIEKWMSCPPDFPVGYDVRSWARTYAEAFSRRPGFSPTPDLISALAARLVEIHQDAYGSGRIVCHLCLIHQPRPDDEPAAAVHERLGLARRPRRGAETAEPRRQPGHDPAALRRRVHGSRPGNRSQGALLLAAPGPPIGALRGLNYAWRTQDLATDLRVFVTTTDLRRLEQAAPDIDELMNVTRVVPSVT